MTRKYSRKRSRTRRVRPKRSKRTRVTKRPRTKRMRTKRHSKQLGGLPNCLKCGTRRKPDRYRAPIRVAPPPQINASALSQRDAAAKAAAEAKKALPGYGRSPPDSRNMWAREDPYNAARARTRSFGNSATPGDTYPTHRRGKTVAHNADIPFLPSAENDFLFPTQGQ